MYHKKHKKKGFLLVELIVAVALFIVVTALSLGSIVSILDISRRVRGNKDVLDSLNASVEYMARIVRFGNTYHCGLSPSGVLTVLQNCTTGASLLAVNYAGQTFVFRLTGTKIEFSDNGGTSYKALTGSNVIIDRLQFYTFGTSKTDNIQPYVLAVIRGRVANDPQASSIFDIQTIMTQRRLDLNI
ncbi:MAG: type II secretion system protein [Patescibacteria group bacterium]